MKTIAEYARRFINGSREPIRCSACGSAKSSERRLISGPSCYICEGCVGETTSRAPASDSPGLCSFCENPGNPVVRRWPKLDICAECLDIAQGILTRDRL